MAANLSDTQISAIISEYEDTVRRNTNVDWDAIFLVAADEDADVIYEVFDTAYDMGHASLTGKDIFRLAYATDDLKIKLAAEVSSRQEATQ